jgi:ankyrin repeat protein
MSVDGQRGFPPSINQINVIGKIYYYYRAVKNKNYDAANSLISAGANVNAVTRSVSATTCLHMMIRNNYPRNFIELFITHQAKLDISNGERKTAQQYASPTQLEDIQVLLSQQSAIDKLSK